MEALNKYEGPPPLRRASLFLERRPRFFNGEADPKGGQKIELVQLRLEPRAHWEFREITLHGCQKAPEISKPNPSKCARCRSSKFIPIWHQYDNWPGAYGEVDDPALHVIISVVHNV